MFQCRQARLWPLKEIELQARSMSRRAAGKKEGEVVPRVLCKDMIRQIFVLFVMPTGHSEKNI